MQKRDYLSSLILLASFLAFLSRLIACHLPWTMPVALITAADGVYHPTSAALIIGRQGRRSIYPDRLISNNLVVKLLCLVNFLV